MGINVPTVNNVQSGGLEVIFSLPLSPAVPQNLSQKVILNQMTIVFSNEIEKSDRENRLGNILFDSSLFQIHIFFR